MRRRWVIRLGLLGAAALVCVCVIESLSNREFQPHALLTVLGYDWTNRTCYIEYEQEDEWLDPAIPSVRFSTSPPNAYTLTQTNSQVLLAHVRLENVGAEPIAFISWGGKVPNYSCRIQLDGKWMDCTDYYLTGSKGLLDSGKAVVFTVWLPADVTAWQLRFRGESAGPRLRTALRWSDRGWPYGKTVYAELLTDRFLVSCSNAPIQSHEFHEIQ
jgi:hypothetical protein